MPDERAEPDLRRDPDLAATAAALREEWRAETEAAHRDAAEMRRHGTPLVRQVAEWMHRGDHLLVSVAGHRFAGRAVDAAADLLSLRTVAGRVDIHLHPSVPLQVQVAAAGTDADAGGATPSGGGFRSRLLARESEGVEVTVGIAGATEPLDGRLRVGADHVAVAGRGGGETVLPEWVIAYVMPRPA